MNQKDDREGTPKSVRPMIYMYDALTNSWFWTES